MYSKLATYIRPTLKNYSEGREGKKVTGIVIHCTAGNINATAKQMTDYFYNIEREASCNYVCCKDGIGVVVEEENRSWCSSNRDVDNESITIEVASESTAPYRVLNETLVNLINLLVDICKRYNFKLKWSYNKEERVNSLNGVNMRAHRDYKAKQCPGDYLYNLEESIALQVNTIIEREVEENMANKKEKVDVSKLFKIMSNSEIPQEYWYKIFMEKGLGEYLPLIDNFFEAEKYYGVNASVLICQSLLETGWFKFTGYVKKEWNNFGGLGATDNNANKNVAIFPNIFLGCVAQAQHMVAYADTFDPILKYDGWVIVDPRFSLVRRGSAQYVEILGQQENKELGFGGYGWASGKDYGYKILKIYNEILEAFKKDSKVTEPVEEVKEPVDEVKETEHVDELKESRDTQDTVYMINPSRINVFEKADETSRIVGTLDRQTIVVIEEANGFGLLKDKSGWVQLMWCSFVVSAE